MKKVLVTGAAGYIGSVLVRKLIDKNYYVIGLDSLFFSGEVILNFMNYKNFNFIKGDLRDEKLVNEVINNVDAVIHLAAIVGDPACSKQPELANEINWEASKKLFDIANNSNIKNFIFASTCSNYGKMADNGFVNEDSQLNPVSLYAELKVKFENYLLNSHIREDFIPTALRFSTVYGISPRMRFDLTVNEFMREISLGKELEIFGDQFWRPYCHVEDLANACILVLESKKEKVRQNVYGVGSTEENYQKKMIAKEILKLSPNANIKYVKRNEDPRDYRVDFSKIKKDLNFRITKTVPDGLNEVDYIIKSGVISDPYSSNYRNI